MKVVNNGSSISSNMKTRLVLISFVKWKLNEQLNKSSNKEVINNVSLVTKEVVNNASLVTYWLVLIDHLITLIEIITEPTLLYWWWRSIYLQLWQCLDLCHIYIHIYEHHCLYNSVLNVWRSVQQQYKWRQFDE